MREGRCAVKALSKIPIPWTWYLGIIALIVMSIVAALTMLNLYPAQMPTQVNSGLFALGGSYAPPMTSETLIARVVAGAVLVLVISVGISLLISYRSENLAQDHPHASAVQLVRRWSFLNNVQSCLGWFSFFLAAVLTISALRVNGPEPVSTFEMAAYVISIAVLAWVFVISLRRGQLEIDRVIPTREDDSTPKWGIIYHNPADPRVFIELDDGQTTVINMARPASWALLALMILPAAVIVGIIIYGS